MYIFWKYPLSHVYLERSSELDVESPPDPLKSKMAQFINALELKPRMGRPSNEDTFSLPSDQKEDHYGAPSKQPSGKWDELQSSVHCHVEYKDTYDKQQSLKNNV